MDNFKNVIGYDHIKHELNRIVDCINNKEKYERFGVRSPLGLLIHGNPGLGKTLIATSFLEAINRNKYLIKKDKPNGEFVRYLKDTITDAINNAPSIVLLDDLDKFANNDEGHRKTDEFIVLQSLIDDAKDKDVFFIATANDLRDMPISLLRSGRFDVKIEVNDPTPKDTALIIEHYLSNKHLSSDIDYEEIAKIVNCDSIATMESIMNEAGLIAGYNDRDVISMHDIIKASLRVVFEAPESQEDKTPKQLELAAYHEAGHVLVAELLEPGSVNLVTVSNYFSHKGGVTSISNNDDYWYDIDYMENRIKMLLAGKAATDIIYGKLKMICVELNS